MLKTSPYYFIARFLACFLSLYLFFILYRGITGEGGRVYSSFLRHHVNLVEGLTALLTTSAAWLLKVGGYEVVQPDYHLLRIAGSAGVAVNPSCLGWAVMSFWSALVLADKG